MGAINSENKLDSSSEYTPSKTIQDLGVSPDLYRRYSKAMDEDRYEDALRFARQIDIEIITKYERSFAATFFKIEPKFTPLTAVYTAEQRFKNEDYEGAGSLYYECLVYYSCEDPASFYGPGNHKMCDFLSGQLYKCRNFAEKAKEKAKEKAVRVDVLESQPKSLVFSQKAEATNATIINETEESTQTFRSRPGR